jgi:hypothetical protein
VQKSITPASAASALAAARIRSIHFASAIEWKAYLAYDDVETTKRETRERAREVPLSVIDLSAAGHQPRLLQFLRNPVEPEGFGIVFETQSDTEAL